MVTSSGPATPAPSTRFGPVERSPKFDLVERTPSAEEQRFIQARIDYHLVDVPFDLWTALEKSGREFTPIERPKGYRRQWRRGDCFRNAALIALHNHDATFVEGIAYNSMGCGFHHAWITLDGAHAVDQTWPTPGEVYFGIPVAVKQLAQVLSRSEFFGSIITKLDGAAS